MQDEITDYVKKCEDNMSSFVVSSIATDGLAALGTVITSLTIVYSIVYSDADKKQTSKLRVTGLHRGPVNSPHKWPVTRKMLPFDDVIMWNW